MVSKLSVHGCLALPLWASGNTVHHGRSWWGREESAHLVTTEMQRETRGAESLYLLQGMSLVT
jgi:hypothetical protein